MWELINYNQTYPTIIKLNLTAYYPRSIKARNENVSRGNECVTDCGLLLYACKALLNRNFSLDRIGILSSALPHHLTHRLTPIQLFFLLSHGNLEVTFGTEVGYSFLRFDHNIITSEKK